MSKFIQRLCVALFVTQELLWVILYVLMAVEVLLCGMFLVYCLADIPLSTSFYWGLNSVPNAILACGAGLFGLALVEAALFYHMEHRVGS